jgi:uncharacterized protein (TIGR00297 family)
MMQFALQLLLCIALGIIIYKKGILDFRATVAAVIMGSAIFYFAGFAWFLLLVVFLLLGHFSTKYKYSQKVALSVAEGGEGRRGIANVLANGAVPTFFALLWHFNSSVILGPFLKAGYIAAVATVAGDTLSSEIGVLSKKKPVLITTFKRVQTGTHGGISLLGEISGILGALVIGLVAWTLGLAPFKFCILAALVGGVVGFHFDSLLGAVLERRKLISNASVNFLSSMTGSLVGLTIALGF